MTESLCHFTSGTASILLGPFPAMLHGNGRITRDIFTAVFSHVFLLIMMHGRDTQRCKWHSEDTCTQHYLGTTMFSTLLLMPETTEDTMFCLICTQHKVSFVLIFKTLAGFVET
jgi:hypothetical protein